MRAGPFFFCTRFSLSPCSQKFVQPTGSIFFSPSNYELKWKYKFIHQFLNRLLSKWLCLYVRTSGVTSSSNSASVIWAVFSYYCWHFKILGSGQRIKNLWRSCIFLTCFWRERPPCKKKKMHKNLLCTTAMTESSQTVQLHWVQTDSLYISCLQIHG